MYSNLLPHNICFLSFVASCVRPLDNDPCLGFVSKITCSAGQVSQAKVSIIQTSLCPVLCYLFPSLFSLFLSPTCGLPAAQYVELILNDAFALLLGGPFGLPGSYAYEYEILNACQGNERV